MPFTHAAVLTAYEDRYLLHGPLGSLVLIRARPVPFVSLEIHARQGTGEPTQHHCDVLALADTSNLPAPCWSDQVSFSYAASVYLPLTEETDIWRTLEGDYVRLIEREAR